MQRFAQAAALDTELAEGVAGNGDGFFNVGAEPAEFRACRRQGAASGKEEWEEGRELGSAEEEVRREAWHGEEYPDEEEMVGETR